MRATFIITTGRCGFGRTGGLFPELRLGFVAIGWCRGSLREHVATLVNKTLADSNAALRDLTRRVRDAIRGAP